MPKPSRRAMLSGLLGGGAALGVGSLIVPATAQPNQNTRPAPAARRGRIREYWLQIESMPHQVVPTGRNDMTGHPFTGRGSITAVVYRAYSADWQHPLAASADLGPNTGFPGPVLRAEVGDQVIVHVRNRDTHYRQPHSLHVHGLQYRPDSDGAWVATAPEPGAAIAFGASYTYHYQALPSSAGTWPYHDHSVDFRIPGSGGPGMGSGMDMGDPDDGVMELGAELGLVGHVIVTEPHEKRPDREFYLVMHDLYSDDMPDIDGDLDCFNGRAFLGNTPTFTARVGEHVRWHVVALGTEFHVFHLHGHRWRSAAGPYIDAIVLGPATSTVVDYVEDNPGRWLYHCHVVDHMMGGMIGWYTVTA